MPIRFADMAKKHTRNGVFFRLVAIFLVYSNVIVQIRKYIFINQIQENIANILHNSYRRFYIRHVYSTYLRKKISPNSGGIVK